ncbi:hypothetical protein COCCADRAFT_40799 [Bipolaris zeicola 26-R-13]|uniref:NAD-dependent epimerase/dehydratase domain-containing protein n=1 Tax=Cochliobolus carbonum (strain 26-R-13) TaxID=930089 RepID=W6YC77_COCC2|nr:uncharacterized protein COCCADRAFT_40799 [Bipolaris zeicola 26-R-13]EUC28731.1 hypothetical protein COCCADRAFT_40799 [Bipolaris zeicola 26-R-13]
MSSFFASKAFVVTGGASGIGLSTVLELASYGATVHAVDLATSCPPILKREKVYYHGSTNISSRTDVSRAFQNVYKHSPEVYGLVTSAGICPSSGVRIESDETFKNIVDVNLIGTWNCATELLRCIEASDDGSLKSDRASLVLIGSSASLKGFPTLGRYAPSKHAVAGLTRVWSEDFAPFGVRVNLVAPSGTDTPMTRDVLARAKAVGPEEGKRIRDHAENLVPMKRQGRPEEIADGIYYVPQPLVHKCLLCAISFPSSKLIRQGSSQEFIDLSKPLVEFW